MSVAFYAGSFDPVTNGHLDIIERSRHLFDQVIVGIGVNPEKKWWFTHDERLDLLQPYIEQMSNVRVVCYGGLTVTAAAEFKATMLLRGVRDADDLKTERRNARINRRISGMETLLMLPSDEHMMLSSSYVRQLWIYGNKNPEILRSLVPDNVLEAIKRKDM